MLIYICLFLPDLIEGCLQDSNILQPPTVQGGEKPALQNEQQTAPSNVVCASQPAHKRLRLDVDNSTTFPLSGEL